MIVLDSRGADLFEVVALEVHRVCCRSQLHEPHVSLIFGELEGVAKAVVATAEFDPLCDEGEAYAAALERAGVPVEQVRYDGLVHGFIDMVAASRRLRPQ